jgi:hypothetical protein
LAWTCWLSALCAALAGGEGGLLSARQAPPGAGDVASVPDQGAIKVEVPVSDLPVIMPTTQRATSRAARRPPSGLLLLDCLCQAQKDPSGNWWTIKDANDQTLSLLPCRWLEAMEDLQSAGPVQFRLWGEVFHYRGGEYLMVRKVLLVEPQGSRELRPPPAGAPATTSAPSQPAEATAEEVARELLSTRPGKPVVPVTLPPSPPLAAPSVAPPAEPFKPGPGSMVTNRLVRLLPPADSEWALLAFESDNTLRDPPLRVLPNEWLERMENLAASVRTHGVVFHVSGEVHRYHGCDYILVRSAIRKRDMDQF